MPVLTTNVRHCRASVRSAPFSAEPARK